MRRFVLCLLLFALVLAICFVSTSAVQKNTDALGTIVNAALRDVLAGNTASAKMNATNCEAYWHAHEHAFYLYLDHDAFSELEFLICSVSVFVPTNPHLAAEQLQRCSVILENLAAQQKITLGNVF